MGIHYTILTNFCLKIYQNKNLPEILTEKLTLFQCAVKMLKSLTNIWLSLFSSTVRQERLSQFKINIVSNSFYVVIFYNITNT